MKPCRVHYYYIPLDDAEVKKKCNGLKQKGTMGDKINPLKPENLGQEKHQSERNFI